MDLGPTNLLQLTADIVVAHLSNNTLSGDELPELIRSIHAALSEPSPMPAASATPAARPLVPAVPIKASVFPDYIICLEDGKKLKMLKRHLGTAYGMTIDEYRTKWGLPSNYPVTAPNYAKHRSTLAKQFGLGRKSEAASDEPKAQEVPGRKQRAKAPA